jgi:hypothetical protein
LCYNHRRKTYACVTVGAQHGFVVAGVIRRYLEQEKVANARY